MLWFESYSPSSKVLFYYKTNTSADGKKHMLTPLIKTIQSAGHNTNKLVFGFWKRWFIFSNVKKLANYLHDSLKQQMYTVILIYTALENVFINVWIQLET